MDYISLSFKSPGKDSEDKGTSNPVVKEKLRVETT